MLTCAIGDVHGHLGKLEGLLDRCRTFAAGREMQLVFIGDYADRGPDSRRVVELLMDLQLSLGDRVICLRGNHEEVIVAAAREQLSALPGGPTMADWLGDKGGGAATLVSYAIEHPRDIAAEHLQWMASLPLFHDDGKRFFAHAGVRPGRPLAEQDAEDLLWIREPFLSHPDPFGRLVVHGHTPTTSRRYDMRSNRLNLDTAAGYGGPITAAIFDADETAPIAFLAEPD